MAESTATKEQEVNQDQETEDMKDIHPKTKMNMSISIQEWKTPELRTPARTPENNMSLLKDTTMNEGQEEMNLMTDT